MDKNDVQNYKTKKEGTWSALSLAWQLGYSIAVPLVVFALLGRFADRKLETSPWFLLAGIILSLVVSTIMVYRKTISILGDFSNKKEDDNKE